MECHKSYPVSSKFDVCVCVCVRVRRISPPSVDELQTRLCARATEDEAGVQRRLVLAKSGTVQWCVCVRVCVCMFMVVNVYLVDV